MHLLHLNKLKEVKKFQAWEETASKKLEASFDAVGAASATSNATETEAAVAAFDKQAAENVAELEALGIKSERSFTNLFLCIKNT